MLDGNPRLNFASSVTTWMEPECDKLIMSSLNKNYVDMDEYLVTTELQNRCVNMIAHLFHAPVGESEPAVGVGIVGSSEAIMLAGLAFKRMWQAKRKSEGKSYDKPNIIIGSNVQVCWEKFARYFEVELKVKLKEGYYVMDPVKAVEMVDENTICVTTILGSTLTGEFEDMKLLISLLTDKNSEMGWNTPVHVDAASGGFIAPFLYPDLEWDFRLPLVKSINVSGHKYGLVHPGVGWVVRRSKEDLPEELVFHIIYLGSHQPTFTLNFSKGLHKHNGELHGICMREGITNIGRFEIISNDIRVPLIAFSLKGGSKPTVFEISEYLRRFGWIVPAFTLPPNAEHVTVLTVVIQEDFSHTLAERLVTDLEKVLKEMDKLPVGGAAKAADASGKIQDKVAACRAIEKSVKESSEEVISCWRRKVSEVC